jgi:hypothetical protein
MQASKVPHRRIKPLHALLLVALFQLSACDTSSPTSIPAASPLPTSVSPILAVSPSVNPTATAASAAPSSALSGSTIPGVTQCGMVEMTGAKVTNGQAALDAEECFWQAYQRCVNGATLGFRVVTGTDTSVAGLYQLEASSAGCVIHLDAGASVVIRNSLGTETGQGGAPIFGACSSLTRDSSGTLHFIGCPSSVDLPAPGMLAP